MVGQNRNRPLSYRIDVDNEQQRFRELIIFIATASAEDGPFGATKLNKLMWRSDFTAFMRTGKPITGAEYQRLENGPAPRVFLPVRDQLIREGAIEIERREYGGFWQKRVIAKRSADISFFHPSEIRLVTEIIEENWGKSATQMSVESHGLAWRVRSDGDLIPYESAYLSDEPVTLSDITMTQELVARLGLPDGQKETP